MIELVLSLLVILRRDDPPLDGVAVGTRTWRVSRDTEQSSPTLAARLQAVTVLSARWQELVERKLTKAISKLTKKHGGSLTIFAVLTARTLYTYKYEVAINNDKLHRPAFSFFEWVGEISQRR